MLVEGFQDLLGPFSPSGGFSDHREDALHVPDRVRAVRAEGGQHRHAALFELGDDLVVGAERLDDDQVRIGRVQGVQVRLAAGANVCDAFFGEGFGTDVGAVAFGVGDGHGGDAQGEGVLDLLPFQHGDALGRLVQLYRAPDAVGQRDRAG